MHVSAERDPVPVPFLHGPDIHPRHRIQRVQRVRVRVHQLIENRLDVPVRMLDDDRAHLPLRRDELFEVRGHELRELIRRQERP